MPSVASAKVVQITGINLKATGTTAVLPATSGFKCIVLKAMFVTQTLSGAGLGPSVSLGSNSTTYDNVLFDKTLSANAVGETQSIAATGGATNYQQLADIGTNGLKFNVKTAAAAGLSVMTGDLYVEYILTPL